MKARPYLPADNEGQPCTCAECVEAGVSTVPQQRVPGESGAPVWLHGHALKRWLEAREAFRTSARLAIGGRGRRGQMERLAREPGCDDE